eukprot:TRINITY_DN12482_c0_g1_i8.p1 TRINITY_DN12482_c0_g1~~TRINITY_DN12482_c0_g1_i8.p1  ORF type:complete len:161 (+),score=35.90 TRINITY_DN12482_c0_g1_i8:215-697(+)
MVASCYRRMSNLTMALHIYKEVHKKDPDNVECLRYLCSICKDLGDKGFEEYSKKLRKIERMQESKENQFMREDIPADVPTPQPAPSYASYAPPPMSMATPSASSPSSQTSANTMQSYGNMGGGGGGGLMSTGRFTKMAPRESAPPPEDIDDDIGDDLLPM